MYSATHSSKDCQSCDLLSLINLFWKLSSKIQKMNLSSSELKPLNTYINAILEVIKGFGYDIIDYTGKKYNFGDNINILNVEGENGDCYIEECILPAIMQHNLLLQKATVTLKRRSHEKL